MSRRITVAGIVAATTLLAGGATALAGDGQGSASTQSRCERMVQRIAERQGITVAQLEAKLKQKALDRVAAALAAKRITEEQATRAKERIGAWKLCSRTVVKGAGKAWQAKRLHALAVGSMLRGAYAYLDLERDKLWQELRAGKSLATVAAGLPGKSAAGLKAAMLAKVAAVLDRAVDKGSLTDARRDELLERYEKVADRLITATRRR